MAFSDVHGDLPPTAQARARDGVEHLQAAARELIAAARAGLDVAEEVVNDPESAASASRILTAAGELARYLGGFGVPGAAGERSAGTPGDGGAEPSPGRPAGPAPADGPVRESRVQRIPVT